MYNEYIYEKKLNEEKLKQIENEKQLRIRKIHLKKREMLSKLYAKKIENFMFTVINELDEKSNKKSYFNRPKINDKNSKKFPDNNNNKKLNLKKSILPNNSTTNCINKRLKSIISPLKREENNNTVNIFELPKMKFSPKNDFERIKENIYKRSGIIFDKKYMLNLNKKFKNNIKKHNYDFLKTNQNSKTNISIKNIYPLSISENMIFSNIEDLSKKEENSNEKEYQIFKNRILNSKLIINITNNEKYKRKTFYQGLRFSLLNHQLNKSINKNNLTKIKQVMTFRPLNRDILNKRTEKAQINSINFYQDGIKKFNKTAYMFRSKNKKVSPLEESSDSSFNDNGQEEILKKIICLNYPILNENNKEKKNDDKNILMYLKKLIAKNKKEEKDGEQKQKIFVHKDNKYINYYTQRKNKDDIMKKYSFYKEKNKYILGHKKERKY